MKNYVKLLKLLSGLCCLVLSFSLIFLSFVSYANVYDLMIASDSNALMTLELNDDDYMLFSPRSSLGTVSNTIDGDILFGYNYFNTVTETYHGASVKPVLSGNRYHVSITLPSDCVLCAIYPRLTKSSLPSPGTYLVSFDFASDFSFDYYDCHLYCVTDPRNVSSSNIRLYPEYQFYSGDLYIKPYEINLTNLDKLEFVGNVSVSEGVKHIGGSFAVSFQKIDSNISAPSTGPEYTNSDYESDMSGYISDLSSSVGEMTEEISGITSAIENLQGAMEPHYSNVLTQLHHITEQLHAFYDQIYNNIHLKEYALWQDIKTAIENIDLEVNVNLDKLKTSIDNMSTAIQNKLQGVTDTITGGFDNSGIEQNGNELDSSITEFEEAEQNVLESVNDSLNDFEFDADLSEYKNIVQVISDFLQELYDSSGGFKHVINLSLMLSVASIVIGVYRFKEGG